MLRPKGLAGAVRIEALTDRPERLKPGELVWVEGEDEPRRIVQAAWGGSAPVLLLEGVRDRSAAEGLAGRYLEAPAVPLAPGSYYWHELIGISAVDEDGSELGQVVEVFRVGENEVYRIEGKTGELLIPALRDVVRSIDLVARRMIVRYEVEEV